MIFLGFFYAPHGVQVANHQCALSCPDLIEVHGLGGPGEAIAMSTFDRRDDSPDNVEDNEKSGDNPKDTFDETSLHND